MTKYFAPIRLSENIKETPEGFLVCLDVPIARTGWQVYGDDETPIDPGPDGKVMILREGASVFDADTIASFEGKPITIEHPMGFVTPSNWKELAKGVVQNVRKSNEKDEDGEESLLADLLLTDAVAIQLVKNGLREVSCGYEAVYEQTGEGKGKQTQIVGNHLALVRQGRAGPSYAIHDHKERLNRMSKLAEKLKGLFSKTIDEAMKEVGKDEAESKKEESKDLAGKEEQKGDGSVSYDELMKAVKDLAGKMEAMGKQDPSKDSDSDKDMDEEKESKDADVNSSLEERLKKVEEFVTQMMQKQSSGDADESKEMGDGDDDDDSDMTGDTAMRAEILSPGIEITKDVKVKALKAAYETKDGKEVIDALSAGKPTFDAASPTTETLFIAASEVLKSKRGTGLEDSKNPLKFKSKDSGGASAMTPEKLNEINSQFYSQK